MADDSLIFVHLSDIHFRCWSGSEYDVDNDLRNELLLDAESVSKDHGQTQGILVTGDIAFSGTSEEYDIAKEWLAELCIKLGRTLENVWCIPGNHDVEWSHIQKSFTLETIHNRLRQSAQQEIDGQILSCMGDSTAAELMFRPITGYNRFAASFQCQINSRKPVWQQDFSLNDGSTLCVHGLNSTVVSDHLDGINKNVILGKYQIPKRIPGVTHLVMCHHPPDWWQDADSLEQTLNERAHVELFGHKHAQRVVKINSTLRLIAGAVHPNQRAPDWKPCYNWFKIRVSGEGNERRLGVEVYPRIWNKSSSKFTPDYNSCNGEDYSQVSLDLEPWSSQPPGEHSIEDSNTQEIIETSARGATMETEIMDPVRVLTYRFFDLAHVVRIDIASELGLLKDEDEGLQDYELFERILTRAAKENLLIQLWDKIEKRHSDEKYASNPFKIQ